MAMLAYVVDGSVTKRMVVSGHAVRNRAAWTASTSIAGFDKAVQISLDTWLTTALRTRSSLQ